MKKFFLRLFGRKTEGHKHVYHVARGVSYRAPGKSGRNVSFEVVPCSYPGCNRFVIHQKETFDACEPAWKRHFFKDMSGMGAELDRGFRGMIDEK